VFKNAFAAWSPPRPLWGCLQHSSRPLAGGSPNNPTLALDLIRPRISALQASLPFNPRFSAINVRKKLKYFMFIFVRTPALLRTAHNVTSSCSSVSKIGFAQSFALSERQGRIKAQAN